MPTREDVDAAQALYDEAAALFEAAKADFELLKRTITETVRSGGRPTSATLAQEDELRKKVFAAADRLSRCHRRLLPPG
jgi:ketosteroid isomerase-like protein